ncbi:MAG: hypothetical protein R3F59_15980 [Myxococcota bacterium]
MAFDPAKVAAPPAIPRKLAEVREIEVWSAGRVLAAMGVVLGAVATAIRFLVDGEHFGLLDLVAGVLGGVGGYAVGVGAAFVYNFAAGLVGGVVYEIETR